MAGVFLDPDTYIVSSVVLAVVVATAFGVRAVTSRRPRLHRAASATALVALLSGAATVMAGAVVDMRPVQEARYVYLDGGR